MAQKSNVLDHIPIHYVSLDKTVCGLDVSRDMVMTYNPRRTTCRRCIKTNAWIKAFAALKHHRTSSGSFIQPELFKVEK